MLHRVIVVILRFGTSSFDYGLEFVPSFTLWLVELKATGFV